MTQAEKSAIKPVREAVETFALNTQSQAIITAGRNINGMTTNAAASVQKAVAIYLRVILERPTFFPVKACYRLSGNCTSARYEGTVQLAAEYIT